jgi:transposase-like protein
VKKGQSDITEFDEKIISMYAKGMTTRDIQEHVKDFYGVDISPTFVSNVTDKIIDLAAQWRARPLESLYPIVFLDAIYYKVRQDGRIVSKAAYTCLGIDTKGHKDVLGIWIGEKYPLAVRPWKANWANASTYFKYPDHIRKII